MRRRGLEPPPSCPGPGPQPGDPKRRSVQIVQERPDRMVAWTIWTHQTIWMLPRPAVRGGAGPDPVSDSGQGGIRRTRLARSFNATLDALERSVEARRHLVTDAGHELRTPIASLRANRRSRTARRRSRGAPDHDDGAGERNVRELRGSRPPGRRRALRWRAPRWRPRLQGSRRGRSRGRRARSRAAAGRF